MYMLYLGLIIGGGTVADSKEHHQRARAGHAARTESQSLSETTHDGIRTLQRADRCCRRASAATSTATRRWSACGGSSADDQPRAADVWDGLCDLGIPGMLIAGRARRDRSELARRGARGRNARLARRAGAVRRHRRHGAAGHRAGRLRRSRSRAGCRRWPRAASIAGAALDRGGRARATARGFDAERLEAAAARRCSSSISRPTCTSWPTSEHALHLVEANAPGLDATAAGHDRRAPAGVGELVFRQRRRRTAAGQRRSGRSAPA